MRADLFSRSTASGRLLGVALIALAATGCKTEKDPDQPTLLGAPPTTAYLGVEYYYNWGAYGGGESILDYSLTNAPPGLRWKTPAIRPVRVLSCAVCLGYPAATGVKLILARPREYRDSHHGRPHGGFSAV